MFPWLQSLLLAHIYILLSLSFDVLMIHRLSVHLVLCRCKCNVHQKMPIFQIQDYLLNAIRQKLWLKNNNFLCIISNPDSTVSAIYYSRYVDCYFIRK